MRSILGATMVTALISTSTGIQYSIPAGSLDLTTKSSNDDEYDFHGPRAFFCHCSSFFDYARVEFQ
jgi:hypothetical protein